ncbi:MAG: low molecular weight phosphotyrosine protein phosphatase [Flavobacteriales bacterium]|jgi:protein-tyrosine phosphatase|nr:low molecular weight phosphotyrosine protein phosphatase [Flavobacteriales bacterium]
MKTKVLMVCLGNICRSPLAEGLLAAKVDPEKVEVTSAGTGGWHVGEQPDPRSIAIAKQKGLDITQQRGRQFKPADFNEFDYIFVMDSSNYNDVTKLAETESDKEKVQLILDELFPGENVDVPDPYYGGNDGFEQVYNMLDKACTSIAKRI